MVERRVDPIPISIFSRFLCGVIVPMVVLLAFELLLFQTALGKGERAGFASMGIAFVSFTAFPCVMLVNCWTLFVDWNRRLAAFFAGVPVPAAIGVGMAFLVHGGMGSEKAASMVLIPFTVLLKLAVNNPGWGWILLFSWVAALFMLLAVARNRALRRR